MDQVYVKHGASKGPPKLPGQVVLVFQGGGALGAYQAGVYQALHEAGIEPNWVVGTSIGAINGAIVAGNPVAERFERMKEFWARLERKPQWHETFFGERAAATAAYWATLLQGVSGYYEPNSLVAFGGPNAAVGIEQAALYTIKDFRKTVASVADFARINSKEMRLTVGAVNVRTGKMHYFDSRDMPLTLNHVLASGALPPGFPAIRIDGDPYWDGGIYSNTPIEVVFDDNPRRDSVVFSVQIFPIAGAEPDSILRVLSRQVDIQYASRADSHIPRQEHIHRLRHMVRELVRMMPKELRNSPAVKEIARHGCGTFMHIVRINANPHKNDDLLREIDFTTAGIGRRWRAGYEDAMRTLERRPWEKPIDPMAGVAVHDSDAPDLPNTLEKAN